MPYDLVIKNGMVIDGSGLPRYRADVGVRHGRIATIGRIREAAREEIDADGHVVAPGLHRRPHPHGRPGVLGPARHLLVLARRHHRRDGQLRLHARALRRGRRAHLVVRNLERAEDISAEAMAAGIEWTWETFPEYLDAVDALPKGINYAGYIGHSALRTYVMGERAFEQAGDRRRPARDGARAARRAARRRHRLHDLALAEPRDVRRPAGGEPRWPTWDEVRRLVGVMGDLGAGIFEIAGEGVGPRRRRSGPARVPRAAARPRRRDRACRSRSGMFSRARRRTSGARTSTLLDETAARGRAHVRPGAQPRALRAAVVQDPAALRPPARVAASCARCRSTSSAAPARSRAARRLVEAAARGATTRRAVGAEARHADYDWILVFDDRARPAPHGGRGRARARQSTRSRP